MIVDPNKEKLHSFVAMTNIYLPDAIASLKCLIKAQTFEEARDRAQEAHAVLECLLKLSQETAFDLTSLYQPIKQAQALRAASAGKTLLLSQPPDQNS